MYYFVGVRVYCWGLTLERALATVFDRAATMLLLGHIPEGFSVADVRFMFSEWVECARLEIFHYLGRRMQDLVPEWRPSVEGETMQGRCCWVQVAIPKQEEEFLSRYNGE